MSTKFTEALFDKLKEAHNKEPNTGSGGNYLKLKPGNTYTIRLVPNIDDIEKSTFQYFKHAFRSVSSGQFVNFMCPSSTQDPCPFCSKRFELWDTYQKTNDERYKEMTKPVRRTDRRLVNVYVVDDPSNPQNNGSVKLMEYGKGGTIDNCIDQAMNGMMADEQGFRIFDLSPNGMNMQIQVTKNSGGFNEYVAIFKKACALPNVTDVDTIYEKLTDLTKIPVVKTFDEIKQLLDTETGVVEASQAPVAPAPTPTPVVEHVHTAPVATETATTAPVETATTAPVDKPSDGFDNDEVMAELSQYID